MPKRAAFENAGENLAAIGFIARSDDGALAGAAAIELALDVFFAEFDAGRATVDDHADATAVRFAPGRDAKELSEAVAHSAQS